MNGGVAGVESGFPIFRGEGGGEIDERLGREREVSFSEDGRLDSRLLWISLVGLVEGGGWFLGGSGDWSELFLGLLGSGLVRR